MSSAFAHGPELSKPQSPHLSSENKSSSSKILNGELRQDPEIPLPGRDMSPSPFNGRRAGPVKSRKEQGGTHLKANAKASVLAHKLEQPPPSATPG